MTDRKDVKNMSIERLSIDQGMKCAKIVEHYGAASQEFQAISELSELLQVLTRRQDQRGEDWNDHLFDELADVMVMIRQMCCLHGIRYYDLCLHVSEKIDRQMKRIANGD